VARIGLALGSGAARGWAHIGVLRALEEIGVRPDVISGTSVGALVGAAYLTDQLDELRVWTQRMNLLGVLRMTDLTFSRGGLVAVEKAFEQFRNDLTDVAIEKLRTTFGVVATDLASGREVWLRSGPLLDAVRASAAMPGLFPAVQIDESWLVDGALVNPVPVSLCRALGATIVIAVNLNSQLSVLPRFARRARAVPPDLPPELKTAPPPAHPAATPDTPLAQFVARLSATVGEGTRFLAAARRAEKPPIPGVLEIVAGSIDIMQDRITRARMAGDPAELTLAPGVGHIGILEFDRAEEMVEIGYAVTLAQRGAIERLVSP
jgi:NTE family protein